MCANVDATNLEGGAIGGAGRGKMTEQWRMRIGKGSKNSGRGGLGERVRRVGEWVRGEGPIGGGTKKSCGTRDVLCFICTTHTS